MLESAARGSPAFPRNRLHEASAAAARETQCTLASREYLSFACSGQSNVLVSARVQQVVQTSRGNGAAGSFGLGGGLRRSGCAPTPLSVTAYVRRLASGTGAGMCGDAAPAEKLGGRDFQRFPNEPSGMRWNYLRFAPLRSSSAVSREGGELLASASPYERPYPERCTCEAWRTCVA